MNSTLRTAIVAILAAIIAVFAYSQVNGFLDRRHQLEAQRQDIQKSIAENTAGVTELLELETNPGNITYAEIFERGDDRIKKLADAVIPVATSQLPDDEKEGLKTYLDGLANLLRSQMAKYRKQLAVSTNLETIKREEDNLDYSNEYELRDLSSARAELTTAITESTEAEENFAEQLASVQKTNDALRPKLSGYSLLDAALLASAISKNVVKPTKN